MSEEFEKAIIGACIRFPENIPVIIDGLKDEDFSSFKLKAIFKGIGHHVEKDIPVDHLSLSNTLRIQGKEIHPSDLIELEDSYFDGMEIDYYKDQIKISSKRKKLQSFLSQSIEEVKDLSIEYSELEGKITQGIMGLLDYGNDHHLKTTKAVLDDILDTYYERKTKKGAREIFGIRTGFRSIDNILGGLQDGTLGILAGRQHHGKSTVAMDMFLSAVRTETPSFYISLEQPSSEILLYFIQKETGIKPLNIKSGNLTECQERTLTQETYSQFKKFPVFFEDRTRTLNEVSMKIRRMVLSHKVKFVVVDYLQLIENPLKGEPRHIQVAGVSRGLKRLAIELNIPILALSQLNKNPEERETKKIYLSDMRESEAISQDADYVIFIHRPILMGKDDKDYLELAKNRQGETISRINIVWSKIRNTYKELEGNERQGVI